MSTISGAGWTCMACGRWVTAGMNHSCGLIAVSRPYDWPHSLPDFKKCPTCGLEWRGAEICPHCAHIADLHGLTLDYENAAAERDQARDWCRKLVRLFRETQALMDEMQEQRIGASNQHSGIDDEYRALPPELRAAIEEAK